MTGVRLYTDAELAEQWGLDLDKFHQLRRRHRWPCVKLGRFEFRFTEDQVADIVAQHTQASDDAGAQSVPTVPGQTRRSARRRRLA